MNHKYFCSNCKLHKEICSCSLSEQELGDRCPRYDRVNYEIFKCNWCYMMICDGCKYDEHEDDNCINPEDIVE